MPTISAAVIIFGVFVLNDELTAVSGLGVILAMGGGLWYGRARSRMQEFTPSTVAAGADKSEKEGKELTALLHTTSSGGAASANSPPRRDEHERVARRV